MAISSVAVVRSKSQSTGSARLLLLIIASHVSPLTGFAWASVPTLARECKLSERQVYRLLRKLEAMGELGISRRAGRVNRYTILAPDNTKSTSPDTIAPAESIEVGCPRIVYTDLDTSWLLARFGEVVPPAVPGV
jgi:Helix-turn-helix domain